MADRRWRWPTRRSRGAVSPLPGASCGQLSLSASACGSQVFRRHLAYEADWHLPDGSPRLGRLLHLLHVACWLL